MKVTLQNEIACNFGYFFLEVFTMHMSDALVSPAVGGVMIAASVGAAAYSVYKCNKDELIDSKKVPMMGVMGAFVFASQMINFTIPGTGSSGHIGGGILLASVLGEFPAFLTIIAVLLIQALFFADGGLLALGCNVFNMGVIPCLLIYPLVFKALFRKKRSNSMIILASLIACILGLQLGSFGVVLETQISGITALPFGAFVGLMQPIHLAIGAVEGIITSAVLVYLNHARPELLDNAAFNKPIAKAASIKKVVIVLSVLTVLIAGGLSLVASANPDGLEWSIFHTTGSEELDAEGGVYDNAAAVQEATSVLPDYSFKENDSPLGTTVSGIVGGAIVLVLACVCGGAIYLIKKRKSVNEKDK